MKFNCGPSLVERLDAWLEYRHLRKQQWHTFFCLIPRRVAPGDCRWLERVERRGYYIKPFIEIPGKWKWKFRPLTRSKDT